MKKNIFSCETVSKAFAEKIICTKQSFGIHEHDKIGLIGINGCGKSTLLKMLHGIEPIDEGTITLRNEIKVNYLPQIPDLNPENTVMEELYFSNQEDFKRLRKYYQKLKELEHGRSSQQEIDDIIRTIDAADGWKIENTARSYLSKLGLEEENKPISQLSGGQKRKLDLVRVLMDEADVLLLDEPTNHLDIESIEWLQDFLANFGGTIIFITHDRYFLDVVSTKIMEISQGNIRFYEGNYSFYLRKKEMEQIDLERKETRRQAQLKKEIKWLQRGAKARTSKPKNHLDRVRELIDKSYLTNDSELNISFQTKRLGKTILELKKVSKQYDSKVLFKDFQHIFQKKERIGLIGPNGCGKTTLLKVITQEIEATNGFVKKGLHTKFAYFRQDQEDFDGDKSVLQYIQDYANYIRTKDGVLHSSREMLERFLFDGKMQQSKLRSLSGGERKRLYLLRSLMFGSNFIILDEPTNDLDIKTLEILEDYLDAFDGCLLVVSHDRYFLDRTVDYLFVFEKKGIRKFPGNYSDYLLVKRYYEEEKVEKKNTKPVKNKTNKLSYNEKRELQNLEKRLEDIEKQLNFLHTKIEKEAATLTSDDFTKVTEEMSDFEQEKEKLETRWLELSEKEENS